ncbi:hypothetical protein [Halopseudomonas salegens]|uniref:Uncharacterized protein n=1 Tax=Halopseudomonas salegens TaxID=1434072 RepID=A0A1H2HTJ3_9GAMM|nr:hypothetical protein [Halopseudomonas salegens]SDU35220.1 hypothetical protein SAMN05216210_3302 [Halopseudomonas salegens]
MLRKLLKRWSRSGQPQPVEDMTDAFGFVDLLAFADGQLSIKGWALAEQGVQGLELKLAGQEMSVAYGALRPDVAAAFPGYACGDACGFEQRFPLDLPPGLHTACLSVIGLRGGRKLIAEQLLPGPRALLPWHQYQTQEAANEQARFHLVFATSGVVQGGTQGILEAYRPFESRTLRIGVRLPVLYMRTTHGSSQDYAFDPDFDIQRQAAGRPLVDDNLSTVLQHCAEQQLPLLLTLNGGIWADSSGTAVDWDLTDFLEQDPDNCQWNQHDQVMPDDCLKNLTGSLESPELGRCLTFNCYAQQNRYYKKRNLQQAAKTILEFYSAHPALLIGINLDPDLYLNPFFDGEQWYDFNPGTVKQFRHWLAGSGPYAGYCAEADADLSAYPVPGLTLEQVSALSGHDCSDWDQIDPPRQPPVLADSGQDPWMQYWERFRRHLVQYHYDEMCDWLVAAGLPASKLFSSQGLMAPASFALPFATRVDSPLKNYDSGGMSIEGAKPAKGHIGAIVYGDSAVNRIRMEGTDSLFATLRAQDPDWAVVEHNTADLRAPDRLPDLAAAHDSLSALFNYGARFVSPMAWNGSNGIFVGSPEFAAYTAYRNTPLEQAVKHFMYARADIPRGAKVWTFGTGQHATADGWELAGADVQLLPGQGLQLHVGEGQQVGLLSPSELDFTVSSTPLLLMVCDQPLAISNLQLEGLDAAGASTPIALQAEVQVDHLALALASDTPQPVFDRLRLSFTCHAPALVLECLLLLPAPVESAHD